MLSLDPDYLRSFLAIHDSGSYGAAAEEVNKTQSTISAQMKRLEEILGVTLFEKSGRRNALTADGQRLVDYARPIIRLNDETVMAFRPPEVSGSIRVGTSDDYAQAFLPSILSQFSRTHPGVEVEIVTADAVELRRREKTEHFDALLIATCGPEPGVEPLRTDTLHWIGSVRHDRQHQERLPLALWSDGCSWRAQAIAALSVGGRDWRLAYTTSNAPLLIATVRDGLGITIAPSWYLAPGLKVLEDMDARYPLGSAEIGIRTKSERHSPPLASFLDYLKAHFTPETPLRLGAN